MAETKSSTAAGPAKQELVLTRILGAPRSLVFKTWTDVKHVARWWGHAASPALYANGKRAPAVSSASICAGLTAPFIR